MTILTVALLAVIWKLSSGDVETEKREAKKKASPREILSSLKSLINYRPVRLYIFCVAVLGFAMVLVDTVLQIQIEKLGGSRSFSGLTTLSSILGGIPIFWYSKRIFVHQGGWKMLWYAMAIVMFRLPLLAHFVVTEDDLSYILPIQLFHGVAFALIWSGGTDYLQHHAPPMVTASTQTILSTTYFTIGQGVGNIFWMSLYDNMGPKKMYMLGTAIVTAAYAASLFAMKNNNRNRKLDDRDHDLLLPMANGSSNSSTYIEGGIGLTSSSSGRNSNAVESRSYRRTDVTVV
jgi:Na+/melibiose symporter-like transporter